MAVRVAKIDAAAAVPVIELTVAEAPRCAAIGELRLANAAEDGIELGIADVEGVVVALSVSVSLIRTGAKWPPFGSAWRPKMRAKNCAAALLSRAGTMEWLRVMVIGRPLANDRRRRIGMLKTNHR